MYLEPFPNFAKSAGSSGLGSLGKWEIGKYVPVTISNFPNSNGHFPIAQIVLGHMGWGLLGNWEMDWARFLYKQRTCLQTQPWAPVYFPMLGPYLFINAGVFINMVVALSSYHKMLPLMLMLILTLILLLILVDFTIHGNINISLDANLGVRSSFYQYYCE